MAPVYEHILITDAHIKAYNKIIKIKNMLLKNIPTFVIQKWHKFEYKTIFS